MLDCVLSHIILPVVQVSLLFEVEDLAVASPATVWSTRTGRTSAGSLLSGPGSTIEQQGRSVYVTCIQCMICTCT